MRLLMKRRCKAKDKVVWVIFGRFVAGIAAVLWLARWFVRLLPRAVGGEGVFAWSELAAHTYRIVERRDK
jgi:hypothetical protein